MLFAGAFLALSAASVFAITPEEKKRELFQTMMAQPDNLDLAFEYAALCVQLGDLEGAVSTLERMLIYAPGLPRIQLELGALYFRLGNIEVSRAYFEAVLATPTAPPEVVERVKVYLAELDRAADPSQLSVSLFAGFRWQSNANAAPDANEVTLNGLPFILGEDSTSQEDWAFYTTGNVSYRHDLASQGDRLEADIVTYAAWQFEQTQLDTQLIEATVGPAFNMARFDIDNTYLGIYGIINGALLAEDPYFGTLGVGARLASRPTLRTTVFVRSEYRHRWFEDTEDRPTSSLRTGDEYRGRGELRYAVSPSVQLSLAAQVNREDVNAEFYDNWEYGGNAGATVMFPSPVAKEGFPWAINLGGGYIRRDYDDPDPTIDSTEPEYDDEYWAGGALNVPLAKWLAVIPQGEYRVRESNYDIRDFEAITVSLGLFARF